MSTSIRLLFGVAVMTSLLGCAAVGKVPVGPGPLFGSKTPECEQYDVLKRFGLVSSESGDCRGSWLPEALPDALSDDELKRRRNELKRRRNEMQHHLLARSTAICNEFKSTFIKRPIRSNTIIEMGSLMLTAASVAVNAPNVTKALAAAAGAGNAASSIIEEKYMDDPAKVMAGVELERTRVFKQILEEQEEPVSKYPISRAINDAERYHGACSMMSGVNAVDDALNIAMEEIED